MMDHCNNKRSKYIQRIKERYVYILIMSIIMIFFGGFYKENSYKDLAITNDMQEYSILSGEVNEEIEIDRSNPIYIVLSTGTNENKKSAIYDINVLKDNNIISSIEVNTSDLGNRQNVLVNLADEQIAKGDKLTLQIKTDNEDEDSALKVYLSKNDDISLSINGKVTSETMCAQITYEKFSSTYKIAFLIIYLACCSIILLWDTKKLHNSVFIFIIVIGAISAIYNPVMDIPDEPAHIARAELTSRGILFAPEDPSKYSISKSVESIIDNTFLTLGESTFNSIDGDYDYTGYYNNYASTNSFISYIPQAIGIVLGKLIGSSVTILMLGRLFNLLSYALIVRLAIKIAPRFKTQLSIIAMMPMMIFIAASFNQDSTTYGLTLLVISYFLKLYDESNIGVKEIAIFSAISILLGIVKLPYSVLGGLIMFIPKEKFKNGKTYYKSFAFVVLIASVALMWGFGALLMTSNKEVITETPFSKYYAENNVNTTEQIKYIISNPTTFAKNFSKNIVDSFRGYLDQISTFGWLSYSVNPTVMLAYEVFLAVALLIYSGYTSMAKKTRIGALLVFLGVYIGTNLILYLNWTTVGGTAVAGVQGRYFAPLLAIIPLLASGKFTIENNEKHDLNFEILAIMFINIYLVALINKYY